MNTRIQTLLAKFKETESTHRGAQVLIGIDEIEGFAALVIRECAQVVVDCERYGHSLPLHFEVTEHFGIE